MANDDKSLEFTRLVSFISPVAKAASEHHIGALGKPHVVGSIVFGQDGLPREVGMLRSGVSLSSSGGEFHPIRSFTEIQPDVGVPVISDTTPGPGITGIPGIAFTVEQADLLVNFSREYARMAFAGASPSPGPVRIDEPTMTDFAHRHLASEAERTVGCAFADIASLLFVRLPAGQLRTLALLRLLDARAAALAAAPNDDWSAT